MDEGNEVCLFEDILKASLCLLVPSNFYEVLSLLNFTVMPR